MEKSCNPTVHYLISLSLGTLKQQTPDSLPYLLEIWREPTPPHGQFGDY